MDAIKPVMSRSEAFRSSKGFILFSICAAMFTDGYVSNVVAPVIPYLLEDRSIVPKERLQISTSLIIACFGMSDIIGGPLCAWYVDSTSNRRVPFLMGLVFMAVGTIMFGRGESLWMLALSRIVQGFASSILYTVGLAVLVDTVRKDEVGKWMGTAMSCNNIAMILSPVLGGIMYSASGRLCVFLSTMALIFIDTVLRVFMIDSKRPGLNAADPVIVSCSTDTLESTEEPLMEKTAIVKVSAACDKSPASQTTTSTYKTPTRLSDIVLLLASPRLLAALYGTFLNEALVASLTSLLPLHTAELFHYSSLLSGLLFFTLAIPSLCGPLAGHLSDRLGPKLIALTGFTITAPLLISLRLVDKDTPRHQALLCVLLVCIGFSVILFLSPLAADISFVSDEIQAQLEEQYYLHQYKPKQGLTTKDNVTIPPSHRPRPPPSLYASSFSLMNTAMASATVVGPLLTGYVETKSGWSATTLVMGLMCASAIVPVAVWTGGRRVRTSPSATTVVSKSETKDGDCEVGKVVAMTDV